MKVIELARSILAGLSALILLAGVICVLLNYEPAIVMSGSMEPSYHTGSLVLVDRDKAADVEIGDAIAFDNGGVFIAHRIIKKCNEGFITKGDANESEDPWIVPVSDVKGKVVFSIPLVGYIVKLANGTPGIILIACTIICMGLSSLLELTYVDAEENKTSAV